MGGGIYRPLHFAQKLKQQARRQINASTELHAALQHDQIHRHTAKA